MAILPVTNQQQTTSLLQTLSQTLWDLYDLVERVVVFAHSCIFRCFPAAPEKPQETPPDTSQPILLTSDKITKDYIEELLKQLDRTGQVTAKELKLLPKMMQEHIKKVAEKETLEECVIDPKLVNYLKLYLGAQVSSSS